MTNKQTNIHTHTLTHRERKLRKYTDTHIVCEKRERGKDRQIEWDRMRVREDGKYRDKQTNKQTHIHTHTQRENEENIQTHIV